MNEQESPTGRHALSSTAMPSISTSASGWKKPLTSKSAIAG